MNERLRVAHIVPGLWMGGLEQLVVRLCAASAPIGVEPCVVTFAGGGPLEESLHREGIPVFELGDPPGLSARLVRRLGRMLERLDVDVAHAHDLSAWVNTVIARGLRRRPSVIATLHETRVPTGALRLAAVTCATGTDAIVACGDEVKRCTEGWLPRADLLRTIGNGVVLPRLEPGSEARSRARQRLGIPEGALAFGYLGRVEEEKGSDLLVDAFLSAFADRPEVHLALIGNGRIVESLRRRAGSLAGERVHFAGEVLQGAELLCALDVYVQPSRREGRSLSMLEAMAAGLPTVAHALPAIREIHTHGETALLVPPGGTEALVAALRTLADDPELRARLGEAARAQVQPFSIEAMADRYVRLYREVRRRLPASHDAA